MNLSTARGTFAKHNKPHENIFLAVIFSYGCNEIPVTTRFPGHPTGYNRLSHSPRVAISLVHQPVIILYRIPISLNGIAMCPVTVNRVRTTCYGNRLIQSSPSDQIRILSDFRFCPYSPFPKIL